MQQRTAHTTPKDFFLYLFGAISLYVSATTLVTLLWQLINRALPETAPFSFGYDGVGETLRWSVAVLIVTFPAYIASMWWIGKDVDREPAKRELWVRRWFIWATLFVAAVVLLGDLVSLLYTFLGGEIALRFVLKSLAVGIVAAAVFAYHWYLLKREPGTDLSLRRTLATVASIAVGAAVIAGIVLAGSPAAARAERNDYQRVSDLQSMQWEVTNFWQQKQRLPENADELVDPANPMPLPTDPKSGEAYVYEVRGEQEFALCATFETEYSKDDAQRDERYPAETSIMPRDPHATWEHGVGKTCYTRTIDPERYPPVTR